MKVRFVIKSVILLSSRCRSDNCISELHGEDFFDRTIEWFRLEGTFKGQLAHPPLQ